MKRKSDKITFREALGSLHDISVPWLMIFLAAAFALLSAAAGLSTADIGGNIVDASGDIPVTELIYFVAVSLGCCVLTVFNLIFSGLSGEKINYGLRGKMWRHMIYTKTKDYDADGGETLVTRITNDCQYASQYVTVTMNILVLIMNCGMYLVKIYNMGRMLVICTAIFIPLSILFGMVYTMLRFTTVQKQQGALSNVGNYVIERLQDMGQIRTMGTQEEEMSIGDEHFRNFYDAQLKAGYAEALSSIISMLMSTVSLVLPFILGAYLVSRGEMTIGQVVVFNTLFSTVKGYFVSLVEYSGTYMETNGALSRVVRFMENETEDIEAGEDLTTAESADLHVDNVAFSYDGSSEIFHDLSCMIPKNEVTAIVGGNGSGKSTLSKLLARLYEPDSGRIDIGGKDASDYSLRSWRRRICLVAQDSPLMSGTIRENICFGVDGDVSDERLMEVAKLSHVYDFVKDMPDGFDSKVEQGASNFSGGQKQCMAIARAMLRGSEYLILDEATSSLDAKRERDVLEALDTLMQGRTTIIIAHSLSAIRKADHVIVMKDGRAEFVGSREDIMKVTDNYLEHMMARGRKGISQ